MKKGERKKRERYMRSTYIRLYEGIIIINAQRGLQVLLSNRRIFPSGLPVTTGVCTRYLALPTTNQRTDFQVINK